MPVPDSFVCQQDWMYCDFCGECRQMPFCHVVVNNESGGSRYTAMCRDCRGKCRSDNGFEQYCTDKAFRLALGRRIK